MTPVTVTDILARASSREEVRPGDAKSAARFERITVDGEQYFVKRASRATDWLMRVGGDHAHRPYLVWRAGLLDDVPASIDHAVVAMEIEGDGDDAELTVLMRDVAAWLVPEGDDAVALGQHRQFIDHLAALSARFWEWQDTIGGLTEMSERLRLFSAENVAREMAAPDPPGAIVAADAGWRALAERSPVLQAVARVVHDDPDMLTGPLSATPTTFLHGDWKMGNLGSHPDGRTILLDWAFPGAGPACWDVCWYLALNRARLPESKEATMHEFRQCLERHGVATGAWFETQLDLCVVGMMATFGWEKALGDEGELRWWEAAVVDAVARQGLDLPGARP